MADVVKRNRRRTPPPKIKPKTEVKIPSTVWAPLSVFLPFALAAPLFRPDESTDEVVGRLPLLVLQAVVTLGAKTSEGHRIEAVAPAWFELLEIIKKDPDAIFHIPWRKLEEMIAAAYERSGFDEVILTPRTGDGGRDIIATRTGWGSVRFIDQVKAYKRKHLVTAEEVRALSGVLAADRGATKGIVTTTSDFAPRIRQDSSIAPYLPTRIELVNGIDLVRRLKALAKGDGA